MGWDRSKAAELGATLAIAMILWRSVQIGPPMQDERGYVEAGQLLRQGHSPYEARSYLYPPLTAVVFERLGTTGRPDGALPFVRTLNILCAGLLAWLCVFRIGQRPLVRVLGAACLMALPPLDSSVSYFGNLTPISMAPALAALLLWPVAPVIAGLLLGLSLAIKPILIAAAVLLPVHRAEAGQRRHLISGFVAALTVVVLVFMQPHTLDFLRQRQEVRDVLGALGSSSIHCALMLLNVHVPASLVALGVLGAAVAIAMSRVLSPRNVLILSCVTSLLALPRVWIHTFALALPLLALAAENVAARWRNASTRPEKSGALLSFFSVVVAGLIIGRAQAWSGSWGYPAGLPPAVLAFGTLLAPMAALFLAYFAREREPAPSSLD